MEKAIKSDKLSIMKNIQQLIILLLIFLILISCSGNSLVDKERYLTRSNIDDDYLHSLSIDNTQDLVKVLTNLKSSTKINLSSGIFNIKNINVENLKKIFIRGDKSGNTLIIGNIKLTNTEEFKVENIKFRYGGKPTRKYVLRIIDSKKVLLQDVFLEKGKNNIIEVIASELYIDKCIIKNSYG
ncbi:MAG: hypothetical protein ACOCUI_04415, partial [bacterium]